MDVNTPFDINHPLFPNDSTQIEKRTYTTKMLPQGDGLEIDGLLNEKAWDVVPWDGNFTVFDPNNGETPSQPTKFKITYDSKFLYVGVRCYDSIPSKIERRLAEGTILLVIG
ncbi:hypothetical protein [Maribacter litopenaei]|uniref:hypothetical protein n=1 Tax=Maribacter litopenaei TaxID=2976127 RepID=UPI003084217F